MTNTALASAISRAAGAVARRYGSWVTYADLVQDGWEWVLGHPERLETDEDGKVYAHRLTDLVGHLVKVAKRERERSLGPGPGQFCYDRQVVEIALPGVWDSAYRPLTPETITRGSLDPAVASNNWEALVADVKSAVDQLPLRHRKVLFAYYGVAHDWREAARILDLGKTRANELGTEAVGLLVDILNGVPDMGVSDERGVTGSRRVMSNAQARATTEGQWEG